MFGREGVEAGDYRGEAGYGRKVFPKTKIRAEVGTWLVAIFPF